MVQQTQQPKLSREMFQVNHHTQLFNGPLSGKSPVVAQLSRKLSQKCINIFNSKEANHWFKRLLQQQYFKCVK